MEQAPTSLQSPSSIANVKPVAQELPHLVVGEQKRSKGAIFGIVVLSLLLLGLPIGIYLIPQNTQLKPQAAVTEKLPEVVTGVFLESKLSLDSEQGIIPVDVYVKSPLDAVNLVNAQITFNPSQLTVDRVATESAVFNKWIEVHTDNQKGRVSIISGVPNPGIKTGGEKGEKIYVSTLYLKPRKTGTAVLQVSPESQIFRNNDNIDVYKSSNDLALNLTSINKEASPSAKASSKPKSEALIVLTSPASAVNYSYFNPINIIWSSFNVEIISSLNLYMNNELVGPIAQNLKAETGKLEWKPQETLALPYIQPANTYQIEIVGLSKDGKVLKTMSAPFGILGENKTSGSIPSSEVFSQNHLTIPDVSRALTNFLISPLKDMSLDLNKDGLINDLDLFLIRQNLLGRGVIK